MAEPSESLITDAHRARIGVLSEPIEVSISAEDCRRASAVLGETDPRYEDATGIAPPYALALLDSVARQHAFVSVLPRGLLTQQEWAFSRPLRVGEKLRAISQVTDIRERMGGRHGYSVLISSRTDFYDREGEHVASLGRMRTEFDPAEGSLSTPSRPEA